MTPGPRISVAIEISPKRVFACALDWPGWCRSGRDEAAALEALRSYATRYAPVVRRAGVQPSASSIAVPTSLTGDGPAAAPDLADLELEVTERGAGDGGTAFGVPSRITAADGRPVDGAEAARSAAIVAASWSTFDEVAAAAPAELRKGPRGGGRDTARITEHVIGADQAYAGMIGVRVRSPDPADRAAVEAMRASMLEVLGTPSDGRPLGRTWTQRYAARRIAWHALDHAWEIEDRTER